LIVLGIRLGRDRWLRGQLKHRCVLTLAEVCDQGDFLVGELECVMMRGRGARLRKGLRCRIAVIFRPSMQ
jgi:hypothetical protein